MASVQLSSYQLEERIPQVPLGTLRLVVDVLLATKDAERDVLYARTGREAIPPERLLCRQVLFSIRSERQRVQHIAFNLLYRGFVGLTLLPGTLTERDRYWGESSMRVPLSVSGPDQARAALFEVVRLDRYPSD